MRATRLLAALSLLWATAGPARAGFKVKLTHLADIDPVVPWEADVPPPAPPAGPAVLACFFPPGCPGDDALAGGRGAMAGRPTPPDVPPPGPAFGPASDIVPVGGALGPPAGGPAGGGTTPGPSGPEAVVSNPEPASLTLAAIGVAGLAACGWRRKAAGAVG